VKQPNIGCRQCQLIMQTSWLPSVIVVKKCQPLASCFGDTSITRFSGATALPLYVSKARPCLSYHRTSIGGAAIVNYNCLPVGIGLGADADEGLS